MVGLFMVIVVLRRLRAGAPQPPDGVAGRHQPRESVTSHTRERYARIVTPRSTSPARTPTEYPPSAHLATRNTGTGDRTGQNKINKLQEGNKRIQFPQRQNGGFDVHDSVTR
ncbi:hypothetical protein PYW07_005759 [Mythimna separata]|uniref:Secreted protein n=1 Tax=Mythimna separata TaxID=271217 RepID=A0AAD7YJH4_MYTSE|nr:hypothetical protein PYW07_005759 [Mythimna separata]